MGGEEGGKRERKEESVFFFFSSYLTLNSFQRERKDEEGERKQKLLLSFCNQLSLIF